MLSGICFGFLLTFLHQAGRDGVVWAMTFSRIGSVSVAIVALAATGGASLRPAGGIRWFAILPLAAVAGILDTTGNLLYTAASLTGRLDVAAVLSSLYPAGTILLAALVLRERASRSQAAGMALAMLAVAMISA